MIEPIVVLSILVNLHELSYYTNVNTFVKFTAYNFVIV